MTKNKNIDFQTSKRNIDVTKTSKTWLLFFYLPVPGDSRIFACTIPVLFQDLAIFVPCQDSCLNRGVRIDVFSSSLRHTFPVEYENHYKVFRYKKNNYEFIISYHEIVVLLIFAVGLPAFDSNVLKLFENVAKFFGRQQFYSESNLIGKPKDTPEIHKNPPTDSHNRK